MFKKTTRLLEFHPPPPPSVMKQFGLLKEKKKRGRKKEQVRFENNDKEMLLKMLVENHVPSLESALYAKQNECDQLNIILASRNAQIDQKLKVSIMKDSELKKLRTENQQMRHQIDELKHSLQKSENHL